MFFAKAVKIYTWEKFFQMNNTYKELVNTGNFALITNEEIKNALLDCESLYVLMKAKEDHLRFDSESALYGPAYATTDSYKLFKSVVHRMTEGQAGVDMNVTIADLKPMLDDLRQKNGFFMAYYEFAEINKQMEEMKEMSYGLIEQIDQELTNP